MKEYASFRKILEENCQSKGEEDLFSFEGKDGGVVRKTFNDLKSDIISVGNHLTRMSLPKRHIGMITQNCYEFILTCLACMCGAGTFVSLDGSCTSDVLKETINILDVDLVIFDSSAVEKLNAIHHSISSVKYIALEDLEEYNVNFKTESFPYDNSDNVFEFREHNPDDMHLIVDSSGTSAGYRKRVMMSATNFLASFQAFEEKMKFDGKVKFLLALPHAHMAGIYAFLNFSFVRGLETFLSKGMHCLEHDITEQNPDYVILVPAVAQALLDRYHLLQNFSAVFGNNLRYIALGAALIPEKLVKEYHGLGIKIWRSYGLTEACAIICVEEPISSLDADCRTAGRALSCNQVRITNGEVLVKGKNVMLGYYADEELTKSVVEDGWLKTGDAGYITEDEKLYITGRVTSMIPLSSGKNIIPEELEEYFSKIDGVNGCVVFSPDFVDLYLMVYSEEAPTTFNNIKDLLSDANRELPLHQRIRSIVISDVPFKKTSIGKIKRGCLEEHYNYIVLLNKIRDIITNRMYTETAIRSNTNFMEDLGMGSFELMSFLEEIKQEINQDIPRKDFTKMNSLIDICNYIYESI